MPALTFLIVDDNELQRRLAQTVLERAGHHVMLAASGDEVGAMLNAHPAAVVVLSAHLREDEIRAALASALAPRAGADGQAPPLPPPAVVIAATDDQRALVARLIERGASGQVARPYDRERLGPQLELFSVGSMPALVLVVDDVTAERAAGASVLARAGHSALEAEDGRAALAVLDAHPDVDLVLSDVLMPNLDGFGLVQAIRARPGGRDLPVLMLTSLGDIATQSRAIELGADDVLVKPIGETELAVRVRSLLRLKSLQRKLARRASELEQALRLREDLTRLLVHDFRNPLARILVGVDLVLEQCTKAGLDDAVDMAGKVVEATLRLRGLTEDLLDVSRLETGVVKPRLSEFALRPLLESIADEMQRLVERHRVSLRTESPLGLTVQADRDWVYRVLQNLIDNALKHAPPQTEITITASGAGGGLVRVEVADRGAGVPEEHRTRIFDRFAQMPGEDRRGVGLGLAFCRLAVEAQGGMIEVTDRADGQPGAVFAFTVPAA
ncbi:MAG TPA: response regulator [Polyangia bacterium]|nr:response regulator [Polyangia bacterium]